MTGRGVMDPTQLTSSVWSWLPVFRAVAETEHIHRAAALLAVSPSAVSRTIRLLEEHLGSPLFVRTGRVIRLNAAGHNLLCSVRDAMSNITSGVTRAHHSYHAGQIRVSSIDPFTADYVLRGLCAVHEKRPDL